MKILVGYDGSKVSNELLKTAHEHAAAFKADVHVLTSTPHTPEVHPKEIERMNQELEDIKQGFEAEGLNCETKLMIRSLTPGEDLIAYMRGHDIDQIIIGVKKRSKLGKFLMGSTAQFIIIEAPNNVLIVK
jgi:nucleotide-binding universal stress UspA family protein